MATKTEIEAYVAAERANIAASRQVVAALVPAIRRADYLDELADTIDAGGPDAGGHVRVSAAGKAFNLSGPESAGVSAILRTMASEIRAAVTLPAKENP